MEKDSYIPVGYEQEKYHGKILRIFTQDTKIHTGKVIDFEYAERSPGVRIIVFSEDSVLLINEWRLEHNRLDLRLPGGKVYDHLDSYITNKSLTEKEKLAIATLAAQKELKEETGLNIPLESFDYICKSPCGATVIWDLFYFSVTLSSRSKISKLINTEEGEQIKPKWHNTSELMRNFISGNIGEDRTSSILIKEMLKKGMLKLK